MPKAKKAARRPQETKRERGPAVQQAPVAAPAPARKRGKQQPAPPVPTHQWHGADELNGLLVDITKLQPDPDNARLHPTRNIDAIKKSLEKFGQTKPVVVRADGVIIAGNGTYEAAQLLGWHRLAAVRFKGTDDEARAYGIADNKTGELAEWDFKALAGSFSALSETLREFTAFEQFEIEPLMAAEWAPPAVNPNAATGGAPKLVPFMATPEQATIIKGAMAKVREAAGEGPDMSDGRALELLCADYLSGS